MGFFQKMRNGLSRFMYGRNGADHLCLATIWTAIALDVIAAIFKLGDVVEGLLGFVSTVLLLVTVFRLFPQVGQAPRRERVVFAEDLVAHQGQTGQK